MPRATETEEFWRDEFTVTEREEIALQEFFLQQNRPLHLDEITRFLMEKQHLGRTNHGGESNGSYYSPAGEYEIGQKIAFPSRNNAIGEVVALREGDNPRYGPFKVIGVRFPDVEGTFEFATALTQQHGHLIEGVDEPPMDVDELFARFGAYAREEVDAALEASDNFANRGAVWLPRLMLVDYHEGHLNIADAMIDVMGEALDTAELLKEIPTEQESTDEIRRFSLALALEQDPRFINVGTEESPLWYLKRLR